MPGLWFPKAAGRVVSLDKPQVPCVVRKKGQSMTGSSVSVQEEERHEMVLVGMFLNNPCDSWLGV